MVCKIGDKGTHFFCADKRILFFFRAIGLFLVRLGLCVPIVSF